MHEVYGCCVWRLPMSADAFVVYLLGRVVALLVALVVHAQGGENELARAEAHVVRQFASVLLLNHLAVGAGHFERLLHDVDADGDHDERREGG